MLIGNKFNIECENVECTETNGNAILVGISEKLKQTH